MTEQCDFRRFKHWYTPPPRTKHSLGGYKITTAEMYKLSLICGVPKKFTIKYYEANF